MVISVMSNILSLLCGYYNMVRIKRQLRRNSVRKDKELEKVTTELLLEGRANMLNLFRADPLGSYTGIPADPFEVPVQDADDL